MQHLCFTLLVSCLHHVFRLQIPLNGILKEIIVIIENDSMRSAVSTEFFSCRFQMTYTVRYVSAGSGRRTDSTPAVSVRGCSTETVSWVSLMFTHPTHPPSNEPAPKQAGVVQLVSVIQYTYPLFLFRVSITSLYMYSVSKPSFLFLC